MDNKMKMSLYTVLNIPENAESETIKQAAQTKINHIKTAVQEKNFMFLGINNDSSEEEYKQAAQQKIKKIKEAYIILSNPKTRLTYDEKLQAENPKQPSIQSTAPIDLPKSSTFDDSQDSEKRNPITIALLVLVVIGVFAFQFLFPGATDVKPEKDHTIPTQLHATWTGHQKGRESDLYAIAISPDNKCAASGMSGDEPVKMRDLETGEIISEFTEAFEIQAAKFHPKKPILAIGTSEHELYLWHYEANEHENIDHKHDGKVTPYFGISDLTFNTDGSKLASVSYDGSVMVWDVEKSQAVWVSLGASSKKRPGHRKEVSAVAFSPDSATLVTGGYDNTVRLWDAKTGEQLHVFENHWDDVWTVDFSADGRWIASGGEDALIFIWDAQTRELHKSIRGHGEETVAKILFMPDSEVLISAGHDRNIRFWEVSTAGYIGTLNEHKGVLFNMALSTDGKTLISGGSSDVLYVWK